MMKRKWLCLAAVLVLALCLLIPWAGAADAEKINAQLRPDFVIVIDGAERTFYNASGSEVHPIFYRGTTYLPVRAIGELMGRDVDWNQSTLTVTLTAPRTAAATAGTPDAKAQQKDISAELRPDFTIVVDGTKRTFTEENGDVVHPILYQGTTYLPVRAIGNLMGKAVSWNGTTRTVTLSGDSLVTDADSFSGGSSGGTGSSGASGTAGKPVDVGEAKRIALAHAGLQANEVTFLHAKPEWENGRYVYDVEFFTADKEYDYEIDANTGEIVQYDYKVESGVPSPGSTITLEKARELALAKVPGAKASDVTEVDLDREDSVLVYEIEILYNNTEYKCEINAATGEILSFSYEAASAGGSSRISRERAMEIALSQVSGAKDSHIRELKLDEDDGRWIYEVEIIYNGMEYEGEIDAVTGTILKWESERLH